MSTTPPSSRSRVGRLWMLDVMLCLIFRFPVVWDGDTAAEFRGFPIFVEGRDTVSVLVRDWGRIWN